MTGLDIQELVQNEFAVLTSSHRPEAVSVRICPPASGASIDEAIASEVAPKLAGILYPGRKFGGVLHVEASSDAAGCFDVAVEVA